MKKPTETSKSVVRFGDIVVVPFPYADKFAEKRRPALVVSGNAFNARQSLVWVAMITSAENHGWADDVDLPLKGTGLSSPSVIRACKIATIDAGRIVKIIGKIGKPKAVEVFDVIATIMGNIKSK
jgi:mRNA interferase MazF